MKKRKLSSKQIEYHRDTTTWVPKREVLMGSFSCRSDKADPIYGPRREPLIVIDGIELSWNEFAQTVLVYEGFQFRLEFIDPTKTIQKYPNKKNNPDVYGQLAKEK